MYISLYFTYMIVNHCTKFWYFQFHVWNFKIFGDTYLFIWDDVNNVKAAAIYLNFPQE